MLFLGLGAVGLTLTAFIGGWIIYNEFIVGEKVDDTESEVPTLSYYHESEILTEPQAGVKYLVEDDEGIDAQMTLDAVMDWVEADEPNIWTGDFNVTVYTWNDAGLVHIHGDASTLIKDRYDDVEVPYFTGEGMLETAEIDLQFA
jgi:hypothetical protein